MQIRQRIKKLRAKQIRFECHFGTGVPGLSSLFKELT
jgi:hypothetical protein